MTEDKNDNWLFYVKNIKKTFSSGKTVCYGFQRKIYPHTITFISGDSGVGKSTFLHLLALLDKPDKPDKEDKENTCFNCRLSSVGLQSDLDYYQIYNHRSWRKQTAEIRRNHFGFLPQQGHLLNALTVQQNLELVYHLRKSNFQKGLDDEIQDVIDIIGLKDKLSKKNLSRSPAHLSGGEMQRLAVARAIMGSPKIIFVDEPTTFLNDSLIDKMMHYFVDKVYQKETTIIIVTHDYKALKSKIRNY